MREIICPIDNRPCEEDCPDRYKDRPGCFLTTAMEAGHTVLIMEEVNTNER